MSSQPQGKQLTLHGEPEKTRKRGPKRQSAYSWTADEKQFAEALIATWNDAFKEHGRRAHKQRGNRGDAVRLYRWLYSDDNDSDPKVTEEDVRKAIRAYSQNPWNIKQGSGSFKPFGAWIRGCPDNVDRELARIGERYGAGAPTNTETDPAAEFATKLLNTAGLNLLARRATAGDADLVEYVRTWSQRQIPAAPATGGRDIHRTERDWRDRVVPLFRAFVQLPKATRSGFESRAANGATAILGHAPSESLEDRNLVTAIAVGLWDFTDNQKAGAA